MLSEEEVTHLLTQATEQEVTRARELSLAPLKDQILLEGVPGSAVVRDTTGKEYVDCTAQAWTLNSGYCNPDFLHTVALQMNRLTHVRYGFLTIPVSSSSTACQNSFPATCAK